MSVRAPRFMTIGEARLFALAGYPIRRATWTVPDPGDVWPWQTITLNVSTHVFTAAAHGLLDGMAIRFQTDGLLPPVLGDSLAINQYSVFYVRDATLNTFKVAGAAGGVALEFDYGVTQNFTADAGTNVCAATAHGYVDGDIVRVSSSGTLPGGLSAATDYYIRDATADTFKLAASSGGSAIDITTTGTGSHSIFSTSGSGGRPQVRRTLTRAWFKWEHEFWWRVDAEGEVHLARAGDLTQADYEAADWTTLSEDCLIWRDITPMRIASAVEVESCALPVLTPPASDPGLIPPEALVPADPPGTTVPPGGTLGGGGVVTSPGPESTVPTTPTASSGTGGGGGGGGGGGLSGDNSTGGGSPSGGGGGLPDLGGGSGGGGGGGGGGGDNGGDPFGLVNHDWLADPILGLAFFAQIMDSGGGTALTNQYLFQVTWGIEAPPNDEHFAARARMYHYVTVEVQGKRYSRYMKPGTTITLFAEVFVAPSAPNNGGGTLMASCTSRFQGKSTTTKNTLLNNGPPATWPSI